VLLQAPNHSEWSLFECVLIHIMCGCAPLNVWGVSCDAAGRFCPRDDDRNGNVVQMLSVVGVSSMLRARPVDQPMLVYVSKSGGYTVGGTDPGQYLANRTAESGANDTVMGSVRQAERCRPHGLSAGLIGRSKRWNWCPRETGGSKALVKTLLKRRGRRQQGGGPRDRWGARRGGGRCRGQGVGRAWLKGTGPRQRGFILASETCRIRRV